MNKNNNIPTVFVILGATGDLVQKKLAPALFNLYQEGRLPEMFRIVGFAKGQKQDEDFREFIVDVLEKHKGVSASREESEKFAEKLTYQEGLFENLEDYKKIESKVSSIDDEWGVCSNKLFYVAASPQFYETILNNLSDSGLTDPCSPEEGWTRVLVEKPLGKNYKSAEKLDDLLSDLFREVQIYRIDHYLGKEMLQNVLSFRFSNNLLESDWGNDSIEKVDIKLLETIGVEDRGWFYDGMGALRDVGQNHLLQMLAFVAMDNPGAFTSEAVRRKRAEVLDTLKPISEENIESSTYRAQYDGYKDIEGVEEESKTETYFKVRAYLNSPKWEGVPFVMESGKRIDKVRKEIVVTFKHPMPCICPGDPQEHYKNKMHIRLEPDPGIKITFWSKKPGLDFEMEERTLDFSLMPDGGHTQYVAEYEKLLLDCIKGDQTLFLSTEEVRSMWEFVDPILEAWEKDEVTLDTYAPDTNQPVKNSKFINKSISYPEDKISHEMGIVGLGKMGGNMARRLMGNGWKVVGTDMSKEAVQELEAEGLKGVDELEDLVKELPHPRVVWLMVPSVAPEGETAPIDNVLFDKGGLRDLLSEEDIVIDGGNSFYKDSVRRHDELQKNGIRFVDVGVSGGPEGALNGSALMIGGEEEVFKKLEILFYHLAQNRGYQFFEGAGAGHFVKMAHNGIEYGMMQALAEGFELLKKSEYNINLADVADVYNHGSVIESRLVGWLKEALDIYGEDLKNITSTVGHTGMGAWTVDAAKERDLEVKVIEGALEFRKKSEENPMYAGKVLSALRNMFGGHKAKKTKQKTHHGE